MASSPMCNGLQASIDMYLLVRCIMHNQSRDYSLKLELLHYFLYVAAVTYQYWPAGCF